MNSEIKMKREAYALVTLDKEGEQDFKILHKTIAVGSPATFNPYQNEDFLYNEGEAQDLARKIAPNFKKVILVQIAAVYSSQVEDLLDE